MSEPDSTTRKDLGFEESLQQVEAVVWDFGRFRKRWATLDGLARFVLIAAGSLLAWAILDWAIELPAWPLLLLFLVAAGLGVWAAVRWLAKPQLSRVRPEDEARVIEGLHGGLDNQLIGSLQLGLQEFRAPAEEPLPFSAALVRALVVGTAVTLPRVNVNGLIDLSRTKRFLAAAICLAAVFVSCLVFGQQMIRQRCARLAEAYAVVMDTLFPVTMEVYPGDKPVVRGRPVELGVALHGARRDEVRLILRDSETEETTTTPLTILAGRASHVVASVESAFTYTFEYGGRHSPEHRILVDDLPEIKAINYELTPPDYTGQPMQLMTGRIKRLQGLSGTTVFVSFAASTELDPELCYVEWLAGGRERIDISGRFGSFGFEIRQPERLAIYLAHPFAKQSDEFRCKEPSLSIEVAVKRDQPPSVQMLVRKQSDMALTPGEANALRVPWLAKDDFGVEEVSIHYEVSTINELLGRGQRKGSRTHRIDPPRDRARGRFEQIFAGLQPPLAPGDQLRISLSAKDNNTETGPGLGKSEWIEILVVGSGFGMFTEGELSLAGRRESALSLLAAGRVKRATDLLQEPIKTVRTEEPQEFKKHTVEARPGQKTMLSQAEDDVGRYFELLSGGR